MSTSSNEGLTAVSWASQMKLSFEMDPFLILLFLEAIHYGLLRMCPHKVVTLVTPVMGASVIVPQRNLEQCHIVQANAKP